MKVFSPVVLEAPGRRSIVFGGDAFLTEEGNDYLHHFVPGYARRDNAVVSEGAAGDQATEDLGRVVRGVNLNGCVAAHTEEHG